MSTLSDDVGYMRRALSLAIDGRGRVEPNPMVGCVIVKDGHVIGEGFHANFGGPHAEPTALAACSESPVGAIAYVTLEPCCHTHKKTPPCVPALIDAKLSRVVVACADPNPAVSGQGLQQLRAAGISVTSGVLEDEAKQLNAAFFARILHRRPYITLKWAQTADAKVATPGRGRLHISNAISTRIIHRLRGRCDAVLIGINTALNDDPLLTARDQDASRMPTRVLLDSSLRVRLDGQLVTSAAQTPLIVY